MSIRINLSNLFNRNKNFVLKQMQISEKIDPKSNLGKYIQENNHVLRQAVNNAHRRLIMEPHSDTVTLMNFGQKTSVIHNNDTPENITKQIEDHIAVVRGYSKLNIL